MAGIEAQGEFQKAMAMFAPEVEARELETASQNALIGAVNRDAATGYQAATTRRRGRQEAFGTILSGAGSALKKYVEAKAEREKKMDAVLRGYG